MLDIRRKQLRVRQEAGRQVKGKCMETKGNLKKGKVAKVNQKRRAVRLPVFHRPPHQEPPTCSSLRQPRPLHQPAHVPITPDLPAAPPPA